MKRPVAFMVFAAGLLLCSAGTVTLNWDTTTQPVDGVKIYWGTNSGNYTSHVTLGNVTSATVTNLVRGVRYYFAATYYTASEESDFSDEVSAVALSTVTNLTGTVTVTVLGSTNLTGPWSSVGSITVSAGGSQMFFKLAVPVVN